MTGSLIFVSLEDWDDVWRRNQFVCAGLAQRHPDRKILFIGRTRNVSHSVRRGDFSSLAKPAIWSPTGYPNITVLQPLKLMPDSLSMGRQINANLLQRDIRQATQNLGMASPLLWINDHNAVHLVGTQREQATIYDITDDWTAFAQNEQLTQRIIQQDAELCRRADAVIVCSESLYRQKQAMAKNLHLIPNGVDAEHYRPVLDATGPLLPEVADWKKPVIGYVGTIHSERVDVALVEHLAMHFRQGTIALVGPDHLSPSDAERLNRLGNVVRTGPVPYAHVPEYLRAFDVCITPHRMTAFTESLNPIKLWEYLAAGKPIVSTDVAGFRDFPNLVHIASTPEAFCKAVERALEEGNRKAETRRTLARQHSWNARIDSIEGIFASLTDKQTTAEAIYAL